MRNKNFVNGGKVMSVRKLTASLVFGLMILCGSSVRAQEISPIVDPFSFDPDFKWFEPIYDVDLATTKPSKLANYGWFASYERIHGYGSRPELINDPTATDRRLDSGWGDRYEIGYMLQNVDNGWLFTATDMGVGQFFTVARERLNRLNVDDLNGEPGNAGPPFGFIVPDRDGNNLGFNERIAFIQDTENVYSFDSYELNKTWRMTPYRYGGFLEPMVGVRWVRIDDHNARQSYLSSLDIDTVPPGADPPLSIFGDAVEQITTDQTTTENEIITGQVGFRYTLYRNRFSFHTDFRVFSGANFASTRSQRVDEITIYDGIGEGSEIDNIIDRATQPIYDDNEEFVLGFDVRGELGYRLTRALSIRTSIQVVDVAMGVWRGGNAFGGLSAGDQDQDLIMVVGSLGIALNR